MMIAAFLALETVWAVWLVLVASEGGLSIVAYLASFYGGVLFGLVLAVWVALSIVDARARHEPLVSIVRRRAVRIQAAALIVVFLAVTTDAAFRVRLALSKPALRAAASSMVDGSRSERAQWIGMFRVREVDAVGGAVRFITAACGFDDCGVVYSPVGRPPRVAEDSYTDLGGGWWHWERSW